MKEFSLMFLTVCAFHKNIYNQSLDHMKPIPGCNIQLSVSRHSSLSACMHYLAENTLVGANESVAGIMPPEKGKGIYNIYMTIFSLR